MINPFTDVNWNPSLAERRNFARTLVIGFVILGTLVHVLPKLGLFAPQPILFQVFVWGSILGAVLFVLPQIAKPFYLAWFFLACCIGIVVSNLLFAAFYYLLITPIGLAMRAFGRDPLQKRFDRRRASYWRDAEKVVDPQRYFRQF